MTHEKGRNLRNVLVAAIAIIPPIGIMVEQIIHFPEEGYRQFFGSLIANYWGDYSIGVGVGMAGIWALANVDKKYAPWVGGAILAIGILGIILNEFYGFGPGVPEKLDVVMPLMGILHVFCLAENIANSKNFHR